METHLYGVFYTIIYVLLCGMFIETFEEKRNVAKKIYRYGAWICLAKLLDNTLADNVVWQASKRLCTDDIRHAGVD